MLKRLIITATLTVVIGTPAVIAFASLTRKPPDAKLQHAAERIKATNEIRLVLDDQVAAWNKGDLDGFMAGYWKSDELTFYSGGDVTTGWQSTLERYRKRYQSEGREMGKLEFSDVRIKQLADDTAWVRGRWKLVTSKETLGGLYTLIVQRMPEGWRIIHDHTSAAPPATAPKKS
jgi:beta-aspartyl-peptidase (threonine type)